MSIRKLQVVLILLMSVLLTSCVTYQALYEYNIDQVEITDPSIQNSERTVVVRPSEQVYPDSTTLGIQAFSDKDIAIRWSAGTSGFAFQIKNKTRSTIKIIWDNASLIDFYGRSQKVFHSGVRYIDRNSHQVPSIIARGSEKTETVIPSDNVYFSSIGNAGWEVIPMFPEKSYNLEELKANSHRFLGRTIQVLLPVEIENRIKEYIFVFRIVDVRYQQNVN